MRTEKEVSNTDTTALAVTLEAGSLVQLKEQRNQLKKFIKSELEQNTDFGIIPGTPKPSLWKPGAEKLANIFKLGSRIVNVEKEIDFENNRATYTTRVEVYHLASGVAISQCEAVCTSMEKKYKERAIYEWHNSPKGNVKVKTGAEQTPIGDLLNTLSKMSLKRAYVGAVILATGASGFFTQDMEEDHDESQNGQAPRQQRTTPIQKEAAENPKKAAKVAVMPKETTRDSLAQQIVASGAQLNLKGKELTEWIKEETGKNTKDLTHSEMETVLGKLQQEIGRK